MERARALSRRKSLQAVQRLLGTNPAAAAELQAFLTNMEAKVRQRTLENYATQLSKVARRTGKPFAALTNEDIRALFTSIERMSTGTKYATYQALRSYFCDLLKYDRQMNADLTSRWEALMNNIKRPPITKRLLTHNDLVSHDDLNKLLGACRNPRDKALLMTLYETGARLGELLSMEVQDINFGAQPVEIKIKHSKTEDKQGRRPVYVFRAEPLLKVWLAQHPLNNGNPGFYNSPTPVWVTWQPTHGTIDAMKTDTAGQVLDRLKARAGIPKQRRIFAHLFRHTRASDLRETYGLDLKEIKELLGHSKIETTDGYLTLNRTTMIQKLQGSNDAVIEQRRAAARESGMPVPCVCGVNNDPQSAFCYQCGRVSNASIARELVRRREDDTARLQEQLDSMGAQLRQQQELLQAFMAGKIAAARTKYEKIRA